MNHKGLADTIKSPSHPPHASKGGYETLQQQCVPLLIAHHPNSWAEVVSKIWYYVRNWRVDIIRNNMFQTTRGLVDDVRSALHLPYTSNGGYEIFEQHWMSLFTI